MTFDVSLGREYGLYRVNREIGDVEVDGADIMLCWQFAAGRCSLPPGEVGSKTKP